MTRITLKGLNLVVPPREGIFRGKGKIIENINIVIDTKSGKIAEVGSQTEGKVIDLTGLYASPGFTDLHAHFRDPGQEWRENIESGSLAAAAGGYARVLVMPNTDPPIDNPSLVRYIVEKARSVGLVKVYPVGAITRGREGKDLTDMARMVKEGAVAFSDDGSWVQDSFVMKQALLYSKALGVPIISHPEDHSLTKEGIINEGRISAMLGMEGMAPEAEDIAVYRDLRLAETTGGRIHLTHLSTPRSVMLVKSFREINVKATCDVTPHHLFLSEESVIEFDTRAKVKPPLRSSEDRQAMVELLKVGYIDAIATDHAPYSREEKEVEFLYAPFGISGIETSFSLALSFLYHSGFMELPEVVALFTTSPARVLGWNPAISTIKEGNPADITIFDLNRTWTVLSEKFKSRGKNTPFEGWILKGKVVKTFVNGRDVFSDI